ncbi:MAG: DUF1080 domain-containing protein [Gemmatimonadota bacterium]|nr:DUF1080 domain-containing protein [Gemmatimonadota bacterium]
MPRLLKAVRPLLAVLIVTGCSTSSGETGAAQTDEWITLFDGSSVDQWRGFGQDSFPDGWEIVDGALTRVNRGGDILSREQFGNFELVLEWKVEEGGNSGIFFRATEEAEGTWRTAPEMQVLDDERHPDGQNPLTSAGSNYGLYAPSEDVVRPAGEWNEAKIIADSAHVEFWLNGTKVVEYELWSEEWEEKVANTKFVETPLYGRAHVGHIGLQDHGDVVSYRNIRVRRLP